MGWDPRIDEAALLVYNITSVRMIRPFGVID
jgi:hypothetical protein